MSVLRRHRHRGGLDGPVMGPIGHRVGTLASEGQLGEPHGPRRGNAGHHDGAATRCGQRHAEIAPSTLGGDLGSEELVGSVVMHELTVAAATAATAATVQEVHQVAIPLLREAFDACVGAGAHDKEPVA
jgi:hypothetical protein